MPSLEILSPCNTIDFDFDVISCSPSYATCTRSYQENKFLTTAFTKLCALPVPNNNKDVHTHADTSDVIEEDITIPGLPPLLRGHPDVHLRHGVMRAAQLALQHESDAEKAFFVGDLCYVYQQHLRWKKNLPEIEPFFAIKCNPDPYVLRLLAGLGVGFDCASIGEISQIVGLGVDPSRIIFANPCKAASFIKQAARAGVDMMTFDNTDELYKIARLFPSAKLVIRILTDDSKSLCRLGLKFGAPLVTVPGLLAKAKELKLDVVGVSFHVGSGCYDPSAFADAVMRARSVFEMGHEAGYNFTLLDIGGGFEDATFETTASTLRDAIDQYFPNRENIRIIAEPGRYYVAKAFSLATNVIARRAPPTPEGGGSQDMDMESEQPSVMYYINDGVYGAFNCILFDHQTPQPYVLSLNGSFHVPSSVPMRASSVWGPTCDSLDCVCPVTQLPSTLQVGDWLAFDNMGAYSVCAASQFNGFQISNVIYTSGVGYLSGEVRKVLKEFSKGEEGEDED
ncbi:unnamed protein product [Somion occarium]|uniref:ornithine decarboxylase n=1 Tax=Somion occarium TaxID=3059160 RepID=A0ABP1E7A4_9APHY